jgi:magnesium chelatase family protein
VSFAKVHSAQTTGLTAQLIDVEVDIANGLYSFSIIGLGDKAIEESRERVSSALKHSGICPPKQKSEKVTVALAPAHVRKHGPLFDVAIAIGYLLASGTLEASVSTKLFLGELSLDGKLRPIAGVLPLVHMAKLRGFTDVFVPQENAKEAAVIVGIRVFAIETLHVLVEHLKGNKNSILQPEPQTIIDASTNHTFEKFDIQHIRGQHHAKRGAEIAAAGGHNIALYGPPGTGKTLLAKTIPNILPPLSFEEVLEVSSIHSIAGTLTTPLLTHRPFRAPHHSSSFTSIVGGGNVIRPGEITLAHKGVLFLDEFPEFDRRTIESLRQPLEDGYITIARTSGSVQYPAQCILVATLNPCPCGYHNHPHKPCTCTARQIFQYHQKISGPIIDRIDMWIHMEDVSHRALLATTSYAESAETIRNRVLHARLRAINRQGKPNNLLSAQETLLHTALTPPLKLFLEQALSKLNVSARSVHKILRVARTIADIHNEPTITEAHLLEALQYRKK